MAGILVGLDGSADAQRALEWAVEEAELRGTPLRALAVQPIIATFGLGAVPLQVYPEEEDRQRVEAVARRALDEVTAERGRGLTVEVTVHAVVGDPIDELLRASTDVDLVVVGSRGGRLQPTAAGLGEHRDGAPRGLPGGRRPPSAEGSLTPQPARAVGRAVRRTDFGFAGCGR